MKKAIILFLFIQSYCFSQNNLDFKKNGDTIYYNKDLRHVKKDLAKYCVIIDSIRLIENKKLYAVSGYNADEISTPYVFKKFSTNTKRLEILSHEGSSFFYHKNGKLSSKGIMKKGKSIGNWEYWYDNENKKMEVTYFESEPLKKGKSSLLKNYWTRSGEQTITNGNGYYDYTTEMDSATHKGNVLEGVKDGLWTGKSKSGKLLYKENYKKGRLISGESWDKDNKHYTYKEAYIAPKFKRGQKGIRNIIVKNFKIPPIATQEKIDGTVLVSFDVDEQGNIKNVKAFRKIHPEVDAEAIRVIKLMKGWKPAVRKGKKVTAKFAIPITYRVE